MSVVWIKEWLDRNKGRPYKNQRSSPPSVSLRKAKEELKTNRTYENAVEVQRYERQMKDFRVLTIKPVKKESK